MMPWLGWIGNILILVAMILLGNKCRLGWVFSFFGNVAWVVYAVFLGMWDLWAVDAVAIVIAVISWHKWGKK